jgi:hypothetical protein
VDGDPYGGAVGDTGPGTDEVPTRGQARFALLVGEGMAQLASHPVPHDRPADAPAEGIGHARRARRVVGDPTAPQGTVVEPAPVGPEAVEHRPVTDAPDQADSRVRPLARRDFRMARPARVDIRCRKPCRFDRRRLLGW